MVQHVIKRFPEQVDTIEHLFQEDLDFQEMCADLETMEKAIEYWMSSPEASSEKANEYRNMLKDLENEIILKIECHVTEPVDAAELQRRIKNVIEMRNKLAERYHSQSKVKPAEVFVASSEEEFLEKALKVVEDNIENENFSVEDLASKMAMSRVQFHRKIRALTNQPTTHFIRSIRLQRAADLLEKGAGNVTEVAYMVGFNSQSYFTKCFTEQFGQSPSEYQKTV